MREPPIMTLLEKINSMQIPFAQLKGVTFIEAEKDRVVASRSLPRRRWCCEGLARYVFFFWPWNQLSNCVPFQCTTPSKRLM
jgi:hypothetical protein